MILQSFIPTVGPLGLATEHLGTLLNLSSQERDIITGNIP